MPIHRSGSAPMPYEKQPMYSDRRADIVALRHQYLDNPALHLLSDETRTVGTKQFLPFSQVAPRAAA